MNSVIINFKELILNPFGQKSEGEKVDYLELMGLSWSFHFIHAFYSILAVLIGLKTYEYVNTSDNIAKVIYSNFNITLQKFTIISTISEAIFYPIVFHFSYKFWMFMLTFYSQVFNLENENTEANCSDVVNAIYASNVFLIIPIAGRLISILAQGFYLFRGLLKKLEFTNLQAFLVLLTPLFLVFLFTVLIVSYFVFIISLI